MANDKTSSVTDLDSPAPDEQAGKAAQAKARAATQVSSQAEATQIAASAGGTKYRITIAATESDANPVKVSVNGEMFLIPRNTAVIVPEFIKHALDNSTYELLSQENGNTVSMNQPRFPMSVLETIKE